MSIIIGIMMLNNIYQYLLPDVPINILNAIALVETNGNGWEKDRIKIRFENHLFLKDCPEASDTFFVGNPEWTEHTMLTEEGYIHQHYTQDSEYKALEIATKICPTAAYKSISIGTFQIHAMHYKTLGFPFPSMMYSYMSESPEREIEVFKRYLTLTPDLYEAMIAEDIDTIAALYNPSNPFWRERFLYEYGLILQSNNDAQEP